jgi:hypothetical protein
MKKVFLMSAVFLIIAGSVTAQESKVTLEIGKTYTVKGYIFSVKKVQIYENGYPLGFFSVRPENGKMDPSYTGVLGIEITLTKGDMETFSGLENWLVYENGKRNVKEDQSAMTGKDTYTVTFNVPLEAKKLKFHIDTLELDLTNVLANGKK